MCVLKHTEAATVILLCTDYVRVCFHYVRGIMYRAANAWIDYVRTMYGAAANAKIMYGLCTHGFLLCTGLCTGPACIMYGAAGPQPDT